MHALSYSPSVSQNPTHTRDVPKSNPRKTQFGQFLYCDQSFVSPKPQSQSLLVQASRPRRTPACSRRDGRGAGRRLTCAQSYEVGLRRSRGFYPSRFSFLRGDFTGQRGSP
jgi:hypothetical protein